MQQFNLEEWLENKSRKICTGDGRPVRIICTDRKARSGNIVGLVGEDESLIYVWNSNGIHIVSCIEENDLFFADEENTELTEFERELEMMMVSFSNGNLGSDVRKEMPKQKLHNYAHRLLDLARKEILKDLPKWKRSNSFFNTGNKFELGKTSLRRFDGYEIPYSELEKLPKEK